MSFKWSPMEIQQMSFPVVKKGFDPEEVKTFLLSLSEQLEYLLKEREDLKAQVQNLTQQVSEFMKREQILKDTLLTAQKMSKEIKEQAEREAELTIKEAELSAEKISQQALQKLNTMEQGLKELKFLRQRYILDLEQMLQRLENFLKEEKERQKEIDSIAAPKIL
ncbi:MAG: DivIVA domain-containing protein [Thermoanaerobaculia bacterium]